MCRIMRKPAEDLIQFDVLRESSEILVRKNVSHQVPKEIHSQVKMGGSTED